MFSRIVSLILFLLLLPVLLILVMFLLLCDGPPFIFSQYRLGEGGKSFRIYKLRTMRNVDKNQIGVENIIKNHSDSRITRIGRIYRKFSFDELPQIYNVLKGDMNFIGPRPILPEQLRAIEEDKEHLRFSVKPGITGLAQVKGRRGLNWRFQLKFDEFYSRNRSWRLDLWILLQTAVVVFQFKGIYGSEGDNWRSYIKK